MHRASTLNPRQEPDRMGAQEALHEAQITRRAGGATRRLWGCLPFGQDATIWTWHQRSTWLQSKRAWIKVMLTCRSFFLIYLCLISWFDTSLRLPSSAAGAYGGNEWICNSFKWGIYMPMRGRDFPEENLNLWKYHFQGENDGQDGMLQSKWSVRKGKKPQQKIEFMLNHKSRTKTPFTVLFKLPIVHICIKSP